jgi:flagellar protein FlbD
VTDNRGAHGSPPVAARTSWRIIVITLHRLNGDEMTLNAELILTVEAMPDTHIQTVDRRQFLVLESVEEVVAAVVDYRRLVHAGAHLAAPITA